VASRAEPAGVGGDDRAHALTVTFVRPRIWTGRPPA
jgi:hypothetical protein